MQILRDFWQLAFIQGLKMWQFILALSIQLLPVWTP
jgi:hypothetical protein